MRQRKHIGSVLQGICLFVGVEIRDIAGPAVAQSNPIVIENQQLGSGNWMWSKLSDDTNQQIKGYPSATSVNQNDSLTFYVSVNPVQNYTIDFYRFGYHGGLGARLRLHVGPLAGVQQPWLSLQRFSERGNILRMRRNSESLKY